MCPLRAFEKVRSRQLIEAKTASIGSSGRTQVRQPSSSTDVQGREQFATRQSRPVNRVTGNTGRRGVRLLPPWMSMCALTVPIVLKIRNTQQAAKRAYDLGRRPSPQATALPAKIAPEVVSPIVVAMFAPFVLAPLMLTRFAETVVVADIRTCATPIPRIESSSVGTRGDPVRTRIRRHGPVAIHPVAIAVIISVHPVI